MATIEVVRPGALTTVQDLGRPGFSASGVPRGGAFDPWAARAANRRVGNPDDAALLEITLAGPALRFDVATVVALCGDPFELKVDAQAVETAPAIPLRAGSTLEVGRATAGVRTWLAIAGGIDVPKVLGSRSTDLAGGFGGVDGRALRSGDRLRTFSSLTAFVESDGRHSGSGDLGATLLRLLPGPDERLVAGGDREALVTREYRVSAQSDRRGVRLSGPAIALAAHTPLRSQGTLPGAVQLPPAGEPIVLGVDAPVTGGYPWIAQLIEADIALLAHLAPGARVQLVRASWQEAEEALKAHERRLAGDGDER